MLKTQVWTVNTIGGKMSYSQKRRGCNKSSDKSLNKVQELDCKINQSINKRLYDKYLHQHL